jgi:type I restriction enzyme M protein
VTESQEKRCDTGPVTESGRRSPHVVTMLKQHGRVGVTASDNLLFEGGAGEIVRQKLLQTCDVHTLLRLPTPIFYA